MRITFANKLSLFLNFKNRGAHYIRWRIILVSIQYFSANGELQMRKCMEALFLVHSIVKQALFILRFTKELQETVGECIVL